MQKDKRYYGRLKAAEKASKKAQKYQSTEDAKMNALREQFGLDRLTAAANGQNVLATAASETPSMTSPQPAAHGESGMSIRMPALNSQTVSRLRLYLVVVYGFVIRPSTKFGLFWSPSRVGYQGATACGGTRAL